VSHEGTPSAITNAEEFRAAGRRISEDPRLTHRQKLAAFIRLGELARTRAEVPEFAQGAVWAELQLFLHGPPPTAPDPVERACRGLVREGYVQCPSCARVLPGEGDFARWAGLRRQAAEWYRTREGALS
jgi:hypothetical protein